MRLCSSPGCGRAIPDGTRFCAEHAPKTPTTTATFPGIRNHTSGYDADMDAQRKTARWQQTRARVVKRQPLCARCDRAMSEIVDHIVPAREAVSQAQFSGFYKLDKWAGYFFDTNLQGLCRSCHGVKTLEDKAHAGPWPDVVTAERAKPKRVYRF